MVSALTTPVVLIFFNRPERTAEVFATIRAARPAQLFVIADGPRLIRKSDASKCSAARAIIEQVDWHIRFYAAFPNTISDSGKMCRKGSTGCSAR